MAQIERAALTPEESVYPLPSESGVVAVTPETASDWLSTRRWPHQRRQSTAVVAKYLGDMKAGRWKLTVQGLVFTTDGYMIDGQHRLRALANMQREELVAAYGVDHLLFWVFVDEPTDTFDAYDQNFRRIASHLIDEPNSIALAAGSRFLAAVSDLDPWSFPRFGRLTTSEVLQTKQDWPELGRYASEAVAMKHRASIPVPPHLAVIAQASRTTLGTPEKISSWFEVLRSGVAPSQDDPRARLRDKFLRDNRVLSAAAYRPLVYSLIVKAWNAHAKGETIPVLRWAQTERIPAVEGFDWKSVEKKETAA